MHGWIEKLIIWRPRAHFCRVHCGLPIGELLSWSVWGCIHARPDLRHHCGVDREQHCEWLHHSQRGADPDCDHNRVIHLSCSRGIRVCSCSFRERNCGQHQRAAERREYTDHYGGADPNWCNRARLQRWWRDLHHKVFRNWGLCIRILTCGIVGRRWGGWPK